MQSLVVTAGTVTEKGHDRVLGSAGAHRRVWSSPAPVQLSLSRLVPKAKVCSRDLYSGGDKAKSNFTSTCLGVFVPLLLYCLFFA